MSSFVTGTAVKWEHSFEWVGALLLRGGRQGALFSRVGVRAIRALCHRVGERRTPDPKSEHGALCFKVGAGRTVLRSGREQ